MSRIFMINEYSSTPATGMGGRTHYLSRELALLGHDVTLIAASHHHLLRDAGNVTDLPEVEAVEGYRFLRIAVPRYAHAHDRRRVLAWVSFAWKLMRLNVDRLGRPDVVLYSSPSLVGFLGAERLARRCGARLVFEARDIWPLTLVKMGGYSPKHPFIRFLQRIEDRAYRNSDAVVSNIEGLMDHASAHGLKADRFAWIANGFLDEEVSQCDPLSAETAAQIPTGKFIVGYTGTLGASNAIQTIVAAATILKDHPDIAFVFVGNGRDENSLKEIVNRESLTNVHFIGAVPKKQIQSILAKFDVCYIGWQSTDLYQFGVGSNKIPEYLYSAKPIIHCYSGRYDPVLKYDAGVSTEAENPHNLAAAILALHDMPEGERQRMGENGRQAALKYHDYAMLARKLERVLLKDRPAEALESEAGRVHEPSELGF
jgi:glycosyltransferase involved in cell wall biosynthesis